MKKIYHQVNISTIYLDIRESHHSSIIDQPWKDCKEFADQLYKEIKSNKQLTRDIFYKYNQKYVDYKDNNGDYYGLSKGDNQKEIEQWIYDNKRRRYDYFKNCKCFSSITKNTRQYCFVFFV